MVLAGQTIEEDDARPPEVLVEGLESARFRYRTYAPEGGTGRVGLERWDNADQLPLMVEVTLTDQKGEAWPPLVVALPLAGDDHGSSIVPVAQ
jgi:general secretion pathway protein J